MLRKLTWWLQTKKLRKTLIKLELKRWNQVCSSHLIKDPVRLSRCTICGKRTISYILTLSSTRVDWPNKVSISNTQNRFPSKWPTTWFRKVLWCQKAITSQSLSISRSLEVKFLSKSTNFRTVLFYSFLQAPFQMNSVYMIATINKVYPGASNMSVPS